MAEVLELIEKSEKKHYIILCLELEKAFTKVWLPSHNLEHHKRVWQFAKELLKSYSVCGIRFSYEFIEALMLAVFFHDVGLTRTLDFAHGVESAKLANNFLNKNTEITTEYAEELLRAIEKHDDKEYLNNHLELANNPSIYSILTVADDLDAFGAIGLYRYIEIYHLREIDKGSIVEAIIRNLNKRYNFVSKILLFDTDLHSLHFNRYKVSLNFLASLNQTQLEEILILIANKKSMNDINSDCCRSNSELKEFFFTLNTELTTMNIRYT